MSLLFHLADKWAPQHHVIIVFYLHPGISLGNRARVIRSPL
jgi:hypothetical protein